MFTNLHVEVDCLWSTGVWYVSCDQFYNGGIRDSYRSLIYLFYFGKKVSAVDGSGRNFMVIICIPI